MLVKQFTSYYVSLIARKLGSCKQRLRHGDEVSTIICQQQCVRSDDRHGARKEWTHYLPMSAVSVVVYVDEFSHSPKLQAFQLLAVDVKEPMALSRSRETSERSVYDRTTRRYKTRTLQRKRVLRYGVTGGCVRACTLLSVPRCLLDGCDKRIAAVNSAQLLLAGRGRGPSLVYRWQRVPAAAAAGRGPVNHSPGCFRDYSARARASPLNAYRSVAVVRSGLGPCSDYWRPWATRFCRPVRHLESSAFTRHVSFSIIFFSRRHRRLVTFRFRIYYFFSAILIHWARNKLVLTIL